ncbi:XF1762 family protein [Nonomuraea recticatena]|uniref:N-acetyltransferase domain-containing protein n=1 Tax=Nonomuraea recticatena TaxID=46178 RepID=A0ABP6FHB1_9ACTN
MSGLRLEPVTFAQACAFVDEQHRHHRAPRGHKFSIGAAQGERLVGVAIVGRPVARHYDTGRALEVTRVATDGTRNACSTLLSAAWRAGRALGYERMITYTRSDEDGASLRAAGWEPVAVRPPRRGWSCPSRPRAGGEVEQVGRTLWQAPGSAQAPS